MSFEQCLGRTTSAEEKASRGTMLKSQSSRYQDSQDGKPTTKSTNTNSSSPRPPVHTDNSSHRNPLLSWMQNVIARNPLLSTKCASVGNHCLHFESEGPDTPKTEQ
ncbi:hypothetical protein LB506_007554 [Fusarium annulatum]|nr:hypothetical protein LB506_007554 [Fusarium annulatum]